MPIEFTCPHCQVQTLVDDQFAGQTGPCVGCTRPITVPSQSRSASSAQAASSARMSQGIFIAIGAFLSAAMIMVILFVLVFPTFSTTPISIRQSQCEANLQKIGLAMLEYHDVHGSFPPAYIADAKGKPMHSWRVLLLPHLGYEGLYRRYNFEEPWDSAANIQLSASMPPVYACPSDPDAIVEARSSYQVVAGPGTAFPGEKSVSIRDIQDGTRNTVLVVEATSKSGFNWLDPVDLDLNQMQFTIGTSKNEVCSHHDHRGANVVTADGKVHRLESTMHTEHVESLILIQDGRPIPPEVLDRSTR